MDSFIIQGDQRLRGEIEVRGAKNSALAILAATVLVSGDCQLHNVPRIGDVLTMIELLASMGSKISWTDEHSLTINNDSLDPRKLDITLVKRIRASIILIGSLVARFREITISTPGGCQIGSRPLDAHLGALQQFGCTITNEERLMHIVRDQKQPERVILSEFSVTATELLLLAAAGSDQPLEIRIAAGSDHQVQDLCWFLQSLGAQVEGIGSAVLKVKGSSKLQGSTYHIVPDPVEAGTFMIMAGASNSAITIKHLPREFLYLELEKFREVGMKFELRSEGWDPSHHYELFSVLTRQTDELLPLVKLHDMPAPGFSPDLLQPMAVLLTQARGVSLIYDWMYDGRMKYVQELQKMGADMTLLDVHRVTIVGPTPLYGKEITSYDLRAGATLIIAALIAQGESTITNISQVDRGYEAIDQRLLALGANIKRD
ncbi:MAG: UDP-N-acetylglucosamine 1-carboxyvinyltransferase [Candidatus Komeilibacteria bacterium]